MIYWKKLEQFIEELPYPRRIIAIGDPHPELGHNVIYTPDYLSVEVIQGCPPVMKHFIDQIDPKTNSEERDIP